MKITIIGQSNATRLDENLFSLQMKVLAKNKFNTTVVPTVSNFAQGGTAYYGLKRGRDKYAESLQFGAPSALICYHGESDNNFNAGWTYRHFIEQWKSDYERDFGVDNIPFIFAQIPSRLTDDHISDEALAQLDAYRNNDDIYLIPMYAYEGHSKTDSHHDGYHANDYEKNQYLFIVNKMAQVTAEVVFGNGWKTFQPISIKQNSNVITALFDIQYAPIQLDTDTVPLQKNYGFEVVDSDGQEIEPLSININHSSIEFVLPDGVIADRLRYAYRSSDAPFLDSERNLHRHTCRGNVKDSDTTQLRRGEDASNWLVHFDDKVIQ